MASHDVHVVVVGAGVVGLACAAVLSRERHSVLVIERHRRPGQETSSRNSGVIHAGIYYPAESLKARACVRGRQLLYARCRAHGLPHRQTGKLLVATEESEVETLERIEKSGLAAGVETLTWLTAAEVRRREPALRAVAGLLSPDTGLVDVHSLMDCYRGEARAQGVDFVFDTEVVGLEQRRLTWSVSTNNRRGERATIEAPWIVNAAGLEADRVVDLAGLDADLLGYRIHLCKGEYFTLSSEAPQTHMPLIYPVPVDAGLGIHLTTDLGGRRLLGPDARAVSTVAYDVHPSGAERFARAVSRYLPGVEAAHLSPDFAGIRPRLAPPEAGFRDFVVEEASRHGAAGLINLVGIESPGLTASEALAEEVAAIVREL